MDMTFRKPILEDKAKIEDFLILVRNDYIPPLTKEEMEDEINEIYLGNRKAILAVTVKRQLVGYLSWKQYPKNKNFGYIANLAVDPNFRHKGISIKLRKMAFAQIKKANYKGAYTTTWHKNKVVIESNQKIGMKLVRTYRDEKFRGPGAKTCLFRKDF
jgi:ribosomal protein S18 acetylase RimI-like enzyme